MNSPAVSPIAYSQLEAGQRILSHLVSHPDLLTTVAALFYYPPWRGPSPCALEALRGPARPAWTSSSWDMGSRPHVWGRAPVGGCCGLRGWSWRRSSSGWAPRVAAPVGTLRAEG